jgi:tRNA(Ile)-lysidine synthase
MTIINRFYQSVKKLGPFEKNAKIAVAVSGGSDSLALTIFLAKWAKENNYLLYAITIDHGIRKESSQEAVETGSKIKDIVFQHHILNIPNKIKNSNIQEHARKERYKLLTKFCNENQIYHLFVGHTINDQVENFFVRLARGSSAYGVSGMNDKLILNNTRILRPLLTFYREELQEFLNTKNIKWVNDPSNNNTNYNRIVARNIINSEQFLALSNQNNKQILLNRIMSLLSELKNLKEENEKTLLEFMTKNIIIKNEGYGILTIENIKNYSENIVIRAISKLTTTISCKIEHEPRYKSLKIIYDKIINNDYNNCTLGGCYLEFKRNKKIIILTPEINLKKQASNFLGRKISRYSTPSYQLPDSELSKNLSKKLNSLPNNVRKILQNMKMAYGEKTIPFIVNGYYDDLMLEFSPNISLVESTINN